jgi:hypothetical protein
MALAHSPQIVTNGLILALDAANTKSYPGSGTIWTDISGNGYKGTLNGGITYSSTGGSALVFGAVNTTTDYVSLSSAPVVTSAMSIEVWGKFNTYPGGAGSYNIVGEKNSIFRLMYGGSSFSWAMATTNNAWYSTGTTLSINGITIGNWNQVTIVYNGTNILGYLNGTYRSITSAAISGNVISPVSFYIGQSDAATGLSYAAGSIASVKLYNRALSANEINQNFNAYRGRYGV